MTPYIFSLKIEFAERDVKGKETRYKVQGLGCKVKKIKNIEFRISHYELRRMVFSPLKSAGSNRHLLRILQQIRNLEKLRNFFRVDA
ncbi:hypothetical protein D1AOALGA4SA_6962 [Olavius algarvensis Delta 1 endosymbiont]|nr:hypothetical protein D1AOALGA4SA_6962 [Olavius algarvensis Delta 1 endosymbiont]